MLFVRAASIEIALSNASGPSSTPPVICPRSAILHSAAASSVPGIFGLTVSTAERIATFGFAMPRMCARSIAFWQMSTLSSSVGIDVDRGVGDQQQPRIRRDVEHEHVRDAARGAQARWRSATTAPISSSVCRLPFISASTSPARASSTAFSAAAWLCSTATIRYGDRSTPSARATARIFASGPTSTGTIRPRRAASMRAAQRIAVARMHDRARDRRAAPRSARRACANPSLRRRIISGVATFA